jgi:hypothetical protein
VSLCGVDAAEAIETTFNRSEHLGPWLCRALEHAKHIEAEGFGNKYDDDRIEQNL